jgi:hypothetical protein
MEISCHDTHRPPEAMENIALVLQEHHFKIPFLRPRPIFEFDDSDVVA